MTQLYKDTLRNQLVFLDTLDEKTTNEWNDEFNKRVKRVEHSIGSRLITALFRERPRDSVCYTLEPSVTYIPFFKDLIRLSLHYFEKAGLKVDYKKYGATVKMTRYDADPESPDEFVSEKGMILKRCVNHSNQYDSETFLLGHTCIFCIQKDIDIKGGDLSFYPNFLDQTSITNEFYYLLTGACSADYTQLSVPLKVGSVVVLSGDTWHLLEDMKMKKGREIHLITATFHYGEHF